MNVPFVTGNEDQVRFIKEAAARDFVNLKGHRSVGSARFHLDAMPIEGVEKLVAFMAEFERNNATSPHITI